LLFSEAMQTHFTEQPPSPAQGAPLSSLRLLSQVGSQVFQMSRFPISNQRAGPVGPTLRRSVFMAERKQGDVGEGAGTGVGSSVVTQTKPKTQKPSLYRVLILNDDYTPMEFVVYVLERFFNKSREDATRIMLHVHQHGVGVCGVFTYEVAETKVSQVIDTARRHQHPLQCTMEKD
jgi:ATP-dependent Clp protease adaptor protein ClpS